MESYLTAFVCLLLLVVVVLFVCFFVFYRSAVDLILFQILRNYIAKQKKKNNRRENITNKYNDSFIPNE